MHVPSLAVHCSIRWRDYFTVRVALRIGVVCVNVHRSAYYWEIRFCTWVRLHRILLLLPIITIPASQLILQLTFVSASVICDTRTPGRSINVATWFISNSDKNQSCSTIDLLVALLAL